MYTRLKIEDN